MGGTGSGYVATCQRLWLQACVVDAESGRSAAALASLRDEVLDSYLSLLLCEYEGISATAEKRSEGEAIDITVTHASVPVPVPILVEAKIRKTPAKRREAADQARARLTNSPRALAFALCYPPALKDTSIDSGKTKQALAKCMLSFAPVQRVGRAPAWHKGSVGDLVESLRNADLSRQRVGDVIEYTCSRGGGIIARQRLGYGPRNRSGPPEINSCGSPPRPLIASLILSNAAFFITARDWCPPLPAFRPWNQR